MNLSAHLRIFCHAAFLVGAASSASAQTIPELYEKARAEKTLNLYGAGPAQNYEGLARKFESQFPDIKITITGGFSNVLNARIVEQMKSGKMEADMAMFQTVQDFVQWKREGQLLAFKPEGFDQVDPAFKDTDGAYIATSVNALAYATNTKLLPAASGPRSALDFLKPEFKGRLIAVYPQDDDAALYLFHTIVQKYGWDYMTRYMAQEPKFIQGHLGVARSVASGESLATLDGTLTTVTGQKQAGQPIETIFSPDDPTPLFTVTAGIFKNATHPNAARLYLTWLLAKEQQVQSSYSSRSDVAPPAGKPALSALNAARGYREFVTNEEQLQSLRKRFEAIIGPVKNAGGVQ